MTERVVALLLPHLSSRFGSDMRHRHFISIYWGVLKIYYWSTKNLVESPWSQVPRENIYEPVLNV